MLDKDRKDYEQLSERSKILDELVPYTDAIHLQDSLQALAKMPEDERNAAIDRVIEALKKKEKEEKRKQAEAEAAQQQAQNSSNNFEDGEFMPDNSQATAPQKSETWYFYNQLAVNQGKATFQRQWGRRENIDDWQRVNKTVVGSIGAGNNLEDLTDEQRDSIFAAEQAEDSLKQSADSAQNDPHKREYYLAQIPFTEEQLEASNKILEDGLHHAGVIFKDRLDNLVLSEKNLRRVADDYPEYEKMDDVYYHLFLLYSRLGQSTVADSYIDKLKISYPKSEWTALLSDPHFQENSKFGVHIEDSLYTSTYEAFKKDRYGEVAANVHMSETRFPLGANRDKFLFIGGLSKLNNGDAEGCLTDMKTVVDKYPKSRISEMAGMIVNGVKAGRRLRGGKFNLDDVWNRRSAVLSDSDSIKAQGFLTDRVTDFKFILVYHPDSLNENKLLFEMARFNFTNFLVRNFEITIEDIDGLHQMQVSGFRSFDEAYQYARALYQTKNVVLQMGKAKGIIISDKNLELIGINFSYKDYDNFYAKHFAPLHVSQRYLLSEPAEVATPREHDLEEEISSKAPTLDDIDAMQSGETPVEPESEIPLDTPENETEAPITTPVEVPEETQESPEKTPSEDLFTISEEKPTTQSTDDNYISPEEETPTTMQPENTYDLPEEPLPARNNTNGEVETPKEAPIVPTTTSVPPTTVPQTSPVSPTTPPTEEPKNDTDDTDDIEFYFDDDATPLTTPNNQGVPPQDFDIEDEYYDLDGF